MNYSLNKKQKPVLGGRIDVPISARDANGENAHIIDSKEIEERGGKEAQAEGVAETLKYDRQSVLTGKDKKPGELNRDYTLRKKAEYDKRVDDFNSMSNDEKMKNKPEKTLAVVRANPIKKKAPVYSGWKLEKK